MKIAMVSHYFESHRGGVEIVAGQLAQAFTRLGQRVTWIACDCDAPPADPAICERAIALPAGNALEKRTGVPYPVPLPAAVSMVQRAVRAADALIVQDAYFLPCLLAQLCAWRANIPVVVIQHVGFVPYRSLLFRAGMATVSKLLTRPALAAAAQVVFISELTRRHFASVPFRRPPMVLFNGVDTSVFTPSVAATDRHALRRSLGLHPERPAVLFVGRFVEKKGLCHLEHMARRRPEWTWVLAGRGPIDPRRWQLPNVRVFSDRSGSTLAPLYQSVDVLVLPSVGEGYPLVIQEALACGLPVVCGDDTATADPAAHSFLVGVPVSTADPPATAQAFLDALITVVEAGGCEVNRHARAGFARNRYSWTSLAHNLVGVVTQVSVDHSVPAAKSAVS
jgi:glycosyltransferase involved in cell wall biosynthesis